MASSHFSYISILRPICRRELPVLEVVLPVVLDDFPQDPKIRNLECENSGFADIRRHQGVRQVRLPGLLEEYKGRPVPFQPRGAVDAVTADSADAEELSLRARWGSPCGMPFYAEEFLKKNP